MNMKEILIKVYLMGCSRSTIAKILLIAHCETEDEVLAAMAMMETKTAPDDDQE